MNVEGTRVWGDIFGSGKKVVKMCIECLVMDYRSWRWQSCETGSCVFLWDSGPGVSKG